MLRDYITIMSQDVTKNSSKGEAELKKRVGDLEGQVKRLEEQAKKQEELVKQLKNETTTSSKQLETTRQERDDAIAEATDLKQQVWVALLPWLHMYSCR